MSTVYDADADAYRTLSSGLDIEGAVVREVFERPDSSLMFVRVGFRGTDDGETILHVVSYETAADDQEALP